ATFALVLDVLAHPSAQANRRRRAARRAPGARFVELARQQALAQPARVRTVDDQRQLALADVADRLGPATQRDVSAGLHEHRRPRIETVARVRGLRTRAHG